MSRGGSIFSSLVLWVGAFGCVIAGLVAGVLLPPPYGYGGVVAAVLALGLAWRAYKLAALTHGLAEAGTESELSVGWPAGVLCAFALLQYPVLVGAITPFLTFDLGEAPPPLLPALTFGPVAGVGLLLALWLGLKMRGYPPGTRGRVRVAMVAITMGVRSLGYIGLAVVLSLALQDPNAIMLGIGFDTGTVSVGQMPGVAESLRLVTASQGTYRILLVALVLGGVGALFELFAAIACWFLLPLAVRRVFWAITDTLLTFGFVAVTLLLPIQPSDDAPGETLLPSIRLAVTALFAVRALFRLIPVFLDGLEQAGFRLIVAARFLRAQKSGFLTTIGALSILAVSFSSCTLTTTLSVMGGFRNDLKEKILGNNAHVVVDREHGTFDGWDPVLETVRGQPGVVAATPYVQDEVMITSATNLGGAVLRGIDPETIGDVTDLPRNMRHGQLEYLSHPEELLRLRPAEMGAGLLSPLGSSSRRGSVFDDAAEVIDGTGPPDAGAPADDAENESEANDVLDDPESERIARELEDFLREGDEDAPEDDDTEPVAAPTRAGADVLPGLIVGQELARTLRLHVGDEVNVVSPLGELGPTGPMPKSRPFRVAGIFYSGMYEFDMKGAYTTLEAAQRFLGVGQAISGIEIKVEDIEEAGPVAEQIGQALGDRQLRVRSWQEVNRNLFGALQLEKLAMFITLGIAILVASFCIVGTLSLMVQEKRKEVGILKAMGATGQQIVAVFMAQGLMIGVLGASTGLGLGFLSCYVAEHWGIQLNPEVYYIDKLPVHVDGGEFIATGIAAVIVCLLATIYPAILGSRLTPLEAVRSS